MKNLFFIINFFIITGLNAQCVSGNCDNGYGVKKYKDGTMYLGEWWNGEASGHGTVIWPNGSIYVGTGRRFLATVALRCGGGGGDVTCLKARHAIQGHPVDHKSRKGGSGHKGYENARQRGRMRLDRLIEPTREALGFAETALAKALTDRHPLATAALRRLIGCDDASHQGVANYIVA